MPKSVPTLAAAVFLLCALSFRAAGQSPPPAPQLVFNADLVILMDESGSMDGATWASQQNLVIAIVNSLAFGGATGIAASVGAFGTTARTFIDLSESGPSVTNTVMAAFPAGGSTCLTCAFELAASQFATHGRAGHPRATILITDGINNVRDSEFAAELAELQAISPVFAIGIGAAVSPTQLNAIASDLEGIQTAFFYAQFTGQNIVQPLMLNMALYADSLHTPQVTPIPEPQTYAMLLAGLALLGFQARRRKNLRSAAA